MHEFGMCESVIDAVEQRAAGRRVDRVAVRVGALLRVVPEAFAQSFELAAVGSVAEGARVEVTIVPARCRCLACEQVFGTDGAIPACPSCGTVSVQHIEGDELVLELIEYAGGPQARSED
jgi:hydrogenase nickel incorporation protein HypA/HybF